MRVDLDEVERDWKEHGSIYEHAPALIAELRAAREYIWSLENACQASDCNCSEAEAWKKYKAATKGDG